MNAVKTTANRTALPLPIDLRRTVLLTLAGVLVSGLTACDRIGTASSRPAFNGVDITGAEYARSLSLPDQNGQPRTLADFKGKVIVVFFGYTQCPDVCPTTMVELAQVKKALGQDGDRVQGVFVSIDPERDTPEQAQAAAKEFKVFFAKVPGKTEGSYTMDHTAGSYLFDATGKVRLFERYGGGADALTADIKALLASG